MAAGTIHLLNEKGDAAVSFDTTDEKSMAEAIAFFEAQMKVGGRTAYAVKPDGREIVAKDESGKFVFPESAEKVVIVPALQGG